MDINFEEIRHHECPAKGIQEHGYELLNDPEVYFVYIEYLNAQNKLRRLLDKKEDELHDQ